jgi:hypothetical protein
MRKLFFIFLIVTLSFSFDSSKIKNLMGKNQYNTYKKLLTKIFTQKNYDIYTILSKLKNNGLLELFFNKAKIVHTRFVFRGGENIFNLKLLNDSLIGLGYYYFYISQADKRDDIYSIEIEFKSEHFIDPVSLIDEMRSRGCNIIDVNRDRDIFNYIFSCQNPKIKESKLLEDKNRRYINSKGVYWIENNNFKKIFIKTKKIDYWHPSIWFYDDKLNLLNNIKVNKKTTKLTIKIPPYCKYIKIMDMYSGENFKRGIIVKGLK